MPFNSFPDFLRWLFACFIMMFVTLYVLIVGILFYIFVPNPREGGGPMGGYCDHFDDLL